MIIGIIIFVIAILMVELPHIAFLAKFLPTLGIPHAIFEIIAGGLAVLGCVLIVIGI